MIFDQVLASGTLVEAGDTRGMALVCCTCKHRWLVEVPKKFWSMPALLCGKCSSMIPWPKRDDE